jgi:AcrR family transcriptional regulator
LASTRGGDRSRSRASGLTGAHRRRPGSKPAQVPHPRRRRGAASPHARRKEPQQERARETVEAILVAAGDLIARHGWASVTTNRIASRAGVSIGSLYQYFPNKAAILAALLEQHQAAVWPVITDFLKELADDTKPIAGALRRLFVRLVEAHSVNPQLNRVFAEELPRRGGPKGRDSEPGLAAEVAKVLRRRPDVHVERPLEAAHVLEQATDALTYWLVHAAPESLDRGAYIDEAVKMLSGYVRREERRE